MKEINMMIDIRDICPFECDAKGDDTGVYCNLHSCDRFKDWYKNESSGDTIDLNYIFYVTAYKQGGADMLELFKTRILESCSGNSSCSNCTANQCDVCLNNTIDYADVLELYHQLMEEKIDDRTEDLS